MDNAWDAAYPSELRNLEAELLARSRAARKESEPEAGGKSTAPVIGLAVSGGGIRSATFAVGMFQAMAQRRVLRRIDFLSTVSGGGYAGSFLGRLFTRDYIQGPRDVEWVLGGPDRDSDLAKNDKLKTARVEALGWLRENGRYLAPRGAGDLLVAAAALLRNWLAVQGLVTTALLVTFMLLQVPRVLADRLSSSPTQSVAGYITWLQENTGWLHSLPFSRTIWWSPWAIVPLALAVISFGAGWAYWLSIQDPTRVRWLPAVRTSAWAALVIAAYFVPTGEWFALGVTSAGIVNAALVAIMILVIWYAPADGVPASIVVGLIAVRTESLGAPGRIVGALLIVVPVLTLIFSVIAVGASAYHARARWSDRGILGPQLTRTALTTYLRAWLLVTAIAGMIVFIDSLGQTIYAAAKDGALKAWATGLAGVVTALTGFAQKFVVLLSPKAKVTRVSMPASAIAGVAAFVLVFAMLLGFDLLSHGIAWNFGCASPPPGFGVESTTRTAAGAAQRCQPSASSDNTQTAVAERASLHTYALWLFGAGLLTFAFGRTFAFLNFSSHHAIYSARLIRSYLGASNPARWGATAQPVTDPIADDDIEVHKYWPVPLPADTTTTTYDRGAPLHIVNVTVNETFSGKSQVQQQDRKGLAMALGPAGMSVGVQDHVVYAHDKPPEATPSAAAGPRRPGRDHRRFVDAILPAETPDAYRAFDYSKADEKLQEFPVEPLSLGRWVGISGAAFSTGLGYRTSLGMSVLAGLANIRLGYWWDSDTDNSRRFQRSRSRRVAAQAFSRLARTLFPVHSYLAYELAAHFPGTSLRHWYLSDGGHFENMGGYELIRRRLPVIIVIDAEADDGYTFEGIANLVRKARIDFQTEIEFQSVPDHAHGPLAALLAQSTGSDTVFGDLASLRPEPCGAGELDEQRSKRHAAIATVRYPDQSTGVLLYIKPTITGDESLDVRQYARRNPPFPQQTTADQFFDEAQWESYRKLGEHIGLVVFREQKNERRSGFGVRGSASGS